MPPPAPSGGRATLDFFAAQASARRRTTVLAVAFALAVLAVVLLVYLTLLVAVGLSGGGMVQVSADGTPYVPSPLQPGLLLLSAAGVATVTAVGTAWHAVRLSAGGGAAVAELLGGTPVGRETSDPAERRLVNVTEEMAIAAGLPVPRLYVLQGEAGINAFAAGYTPGHSVVAVTRGALDRLTRDELQGVVAHELSHVLNADTRIDLRLMAAVGGLAFLTLLGRLLLDAGSRPLRSRDRNRGALALVGLGLVAAGAFGSLCGKLVRYAVARQREWLADASAVQFTRNPEGLAGALRRIAAEGSAVSSPHVPEAAHLFFARATTGLLAALFSTHPPIEERIRRLAPHLAARAPDAHGAAVPPAPGAPARVATSPATSAMPTEAPVALAPPAATASSGGPAGPSPAGAPGLAGPAAVPPPATAPGLAIVARPGPPHLDRAAALLARLPPALPAAAREPFGARALACALLAGEGDIRAAQLAYLERNDPALRVEVERLLPPLDAVPGPRERLALLGLALPALDALSARQATALDADLRALAAADGTVTPFELALRRAVLRRLRRRDGAPPRAVLRTLDEASPEALALLSSLAWIATRDEAVAQAALAAGARRLGVTGWRVLPRERAGLGELEGTLERLDGATQAVKARLLDACVATALADQRITPDEGELVRVVAASLGFAVPPVLSAQA